MAQQGGGVQRRLAHLHEQIHIIGAGDAPAQLARGHTAVVLECCLIHLHRTCRVRTHQTQNWACGWRLQQSDACIALCVLCMHLKFHKNNRLLSLQELTEETRPGCCNRCR